MARRLRLHFATRRSNTDPLPESSEYGLDSNIHMCFKTLSTPSVIQMRVSPRQAVQQAPSPESILLPQGTSVLPQNKKSTSLQISLQPSRNTNCQQAENMEPAAENLSFVSDFQDGINRSYHMNRSYSCHPIISDRSISNNSLADNFSIAASDNGSYSSNSSDYGSCTSTTSDAGSYSNSMLSDNSSCTHSVGDGNYFSSVLHGNPPCMSTEDKSTSFRNGNLQEVLSKSKSTFPFDQNRIDKDVDLVKLPSRKKTKLPLRRCSSLVIFPRSPTDTPPTSPTSLGPPSARSSYQTSYQLMLCSNEVVPNEEQASSKSFLSTAVNGVRLSKNTCTNGEVRDVKPLYLNDSVQEDTYSSHDSEKTHSVCDGFSYVSVHVSHQSPCSNANETIRDHHKSHVFEGESQLNSGAHYRNIRLIRSSSACVPSNKIAECQLSINKGRGEKHIPKNKSNHIFQRSISEGPPQKFACPSSLKYNYPKIGSSHLHIQFAPGNESRISSYKKQSLRNPPIGLMRKPTVKLHKVSVFGILLISGL
ncbi:E3 ubiquitin-protein ligase NEDD4-like [Discoglossus pictus]